MTRSAARRASGPVELENGDRMTQPEFHRLYEQAPEGFCAELIGGIVYVSSPLKRRHGTSHPALTTVFFAYQGHTPGVECGDNTTVQLGEESEPQPDLYLRVLAENGGQSRTTEDDYIAGPPELVAEIAQSSRAIDLHAKLLDYARYGVREYLVVCLREQQLRWFDLPADKELRLDPDGICRVRAFPGLWVHAKGLFAKDYARLMATLQEGLATPGHAAFITRLAAAGRPSRKRAGRGEKRPRE
ncbi:MAG TPA: Uma2 family endonuclease [Gemmataceae bacterium]|nr:Uma2 family endonuclease [Gemmataceae bacterium]